MQSLAQFKKRTYLCIINLNNLFYLKNCTIETKEEYPTRYSFLLFLYTKFPHDDYRLSRNLLRLGIFRN